MDTSKKTNGQELKLNPREKAALEEKQKSRKTRNKYIIVGIIVVLLIAAVIFVNSRAFTNGLPALKVGDTKYTVADVNYAYQSAYYTFYNNYGQYISYFMDPNTPLSEQECTLDASVGTWADYFLQQAESNLVQTTAFYDKAMSEGYELTEDEKTEIDEAMETYKSYAATSGYSYDGYLAAYFGEGNDESTIRKNMARELIVSRYLQDVFDSFSYTDAELDAYYDEHADDMNTVNYVYSYISAAADEDAGISEEEALAQAEAQATAILDMMEDESEEAFRASVLSITGSEASETYTTVSGFLSQFDSMDKADIATGKIFSQASGTSGWYVGYVQGIEDNHYNTVSVRHILAKAADTDGDGTYSDEEKSAAYDAIVAIQEEWLAEGGTEDAFATIATLKTEDTASADVGGLYENIYKGQMVKEFNDFCFADHESGDYAIVYGESGSYAGYHLIYFLNADGELYSRTMAESTMRSDDYTNASDAIVEPYSGEHCAMWRYVRAE